MKVAHLLRKYDPAEWGGTETALHGLCDGLRQGGVDSVVYCPRIPPGAERDPLAEAGSVVKRFRACVPIWGILPERKRQMIAVGGNLMSFELIRDLWAEPDLTVIHSHAMGRIGGIGRMVARRRGLPFLFTTHGGVYDLPASLKQTLAASAGQGWEWGKLCGLLLGTRRLLADADAVITCNGREAALIREHHPGQRVVVQPHGVPSHLYQPDHRAAARAAFPRVRGRDVLLAVGRIDAVKNQSWLIEQLPALVARHPKLLLVLAGASTDEGYTAALGRRIGRLGLEKSVFLAGGLPPCDPRLIGLLQEARAVVLPSVSETFGLVILEAWAAGTPVISTRTSGAESLIKHGETGLLFDLARPEEFHASVAELWLGPATGARLAAGGRQRVMADFDTRVLADRMKRLYENLIEGKHALRHSA
jgi:glycosyltransferase involved in cell wall biosynthesis